MSSKVSVSVPENMYRTDRLVFRAYDPTQDNVHVHSWLLDPHTHTFILPQVPKPASLSEMTEIWNAYAKKAMLCVVVCLPSPTDPLIPDTPIGLLTLENPNPVMAYHRSSSFSIFFGKAFQGKGYAKEAIEWGLDMAFKRCGLHRVSLGVMGGNNRALKVYEKIGFVHEGAKREAFWVEGQWVDDIVMGILDREWFAIQAAKKAAKEEAVKNATGKGQDDGKETK